MITLHSFTEAHRSYLEGRIPLRLLQDQVHVLIGICASPYSDTLPLILEPFDITTSHIDWLLQQPESSQDYADCLGGNVHICNIEADLLQIEGVDMQWADSHGGKWPNVTDQAMAWDSCNYLAEKAGESEWIIFLLCWNDAGGPVFYVQKHLWEAARVAEHVAMTNAVWNP